MADKKVIALPGVTIKPSDQLVADVDVVVALEQTLEKAKRGEIKWVGIA